MGALATMPKNDCLRFALGFAFAFAFAGIRDLVFVPHASPLCGAAPTFLCRRKEK
jgi:hypothetical protein